MDLQDMTLAALIEKIEDIFNQPPGIYAAFVWEHPSMRKPWAELKRKCEEITYQFEHGEIGLPPPRWWDSLEAHAKAVGWGHKLVQRVRKELGKRGEAWTEFQSTPPIWGRPSYLYPACPCPVAGKGQRPFVAIVEPMRCPGCSQITSQAGDYCPLCGWSFTGHYVAGVDAGGPEPDRTVWQSIHRCVKCGRWHRVDRHPDLCKNQPCPDCVAALPAAPSGHEFTGEWGVPEEGQVFLNSHGYAEVASRYGLTKGIDEDRRWILREEIPDRPFPPNGFEHLSVFRPPMEGEWFLGHVGQGAYQQGKGMLVDGCIDGGKRWILRKVEEFALCPKCGHSLMAELVSDTEPCYDCRQKCPPAQEGYEYTGEWRVPKRGEQYLSIDNCLARACSDDGPVDGKPKAYAGRRWILKKVEREFSCPVCGGKSYYNRASAPCQDCLDKRPPAPPGHEHVGEWRPPRQGEWYEHHGAPQQARCDHGSNSCQWILRRVEERKPDGCWNCWRYHAPYAKPCPRSGDKAITSCSQWKAPILDRLATLTRRVEKLEEPPRISALVAQLDNEKQANDVLRCLNFGAYEVTADLVRREADKYASTDTEIRKALKAAADVVEAQGAKTYAPTPPKQERP